MFAKPCLSTAALITTLSAFPGPADAQERRELAEVGGQTSISAPVVRSLSFEELDVAPDVLARVFPLPGGGWGVTSRVFDGGVRLFDSLGQPAGVLGRAGAGPGEFGGPVIAALTEDGLWLADPRNGRLSVFSEDLELLDDRPLPGRVRGLSPAPSGDGVLLTGFLYRGGETHSVARITIDEARDRFGGVIEDPSARVSFKVATAASPDEVWTFSNSGGAVNVLSAVDLSPRERWQLPGEELRRKAPSRPVADEPPVPQVLGVTGSGRVIWLLIGVADTEWSPEVNPARDGADRYWDTQILAIDAPRRAIVARKRLDEMCLPVVGSEISCVDELGEEIRLRELALVDRP